MTPADFRAWLERRRLTQSEAAALLNTTQASVSRWAAGERAIPGPVERLIECLEERDRPT